MCPLHVAYWWSRAMSLFRILWVKRRPLLSGGWLCDFVAQSKYQHTSRCALEILEILYQREIRRRKGQVLLKCRKKSQTMTGNYKAVWRKWRSEYRPYASNWATHLTSRNFPATDTYTKINLDLPDFRLQPWCSWGLSLLICYVA
jgi:hypothetical protein